MAVNEEIVTGRKFRKLIDEATKLWQRISFWTKASDVEFDDGQTAENKMGAISGITSDLNGESENVAASIKVVNELNNKLANGRVELVVNDDGTLGYKLDGADTVYPFIDTTITVPCEIILRGYDGSSSMRTLRSSSFNFIFSIKNGKVAINSANQAQTAEYSGGWNSRVTFGVPILSK